jgi:uncharacterized protein (TIGR00299 family) protein
MSTVLYLDLFSGASGDMLLAALLDLGLPLERLKASLGLMKLSGYDLSAEKKVTHGLSGTRLIVRDDLDAHPARHMPEVRELIQSSGLSAWVKKTSVAVFERLARAEARVHGVPIEKVHFHEIGAVDSLVDIVGFAVGLELLGVQEVRSSPVPLGCGTVQTAHGLLPVPAPATAALLAEVGAPTRPHPAETEIVTPTAAALLAELAVFAFPPLTLRRIGYGIGAKELPWANVVRAFLGESAQKSSAGGASQSSSGAEETTVLIECNIDDSTGEELGFAMERLFAAGALDAWFTPVQMKKNRPGVMLSVLARPSDSTALAATVLRETSTLGVRISPPLARLVCDREMREVTTPWGVVHVKVKLLNGVALSTAPEYEDCARIAREKGIPLRQVIEAAAKGG